MELTDKINRCCKLLEYSSEQSHKEFSLPEVNEHWANQTEILNKELSKLIHELAGDNEAEHTPADTDIKKNVTIDDILESLNDSHNKTFLLHEVKQRRSEIGIAQSETDNQLLEDMEFKFIIYRNLVSQYSNAQPYSPK